MFSVSVLIDPPSLFFFFNDTATTEIYTLSLHDALPISSPRCARSTGRNATSGFARRASSSTSRSEEHTSELQSRRDLVCRLLLEKKKKKKKNTYSIQLAPNTVHQHDRIATIEKEYQLTL